MKPILLFLFMLPFIAFSQKVDTLSRIDSMQLNLLKASLEMNKFHAQYMTGITMGFVGLAVGAISPFLATDQRTKDQVMIFSGVLSTIALIEIIDSHKYTRRSALYLKAASGKFGVGIKF